MTNNMTKELYDQRVAAGVKWHEEKHKSFHELYDKTSQDWFIVLGEEIGEVARAINRDSEGDMIESLVQCAAVIETWLMSDNGTGNVIVAWQVARHG